MRSRADQGRDSWSGPSRNFAVTDSGAYFLAQRAEPEGRSIDFHGFASGATRFIPHTTKPWWYGVALSPDGSTLLYSTVERAASRLKLVEGPR